MALQKTITMPNGLTLSYHRINNIQIEINRHIMLEVFSYPSIEARLMELQQDESLNNENQQDESSNSESQTGPQEVVPIFKYIEWTTFPYDPNVTLESAYALLKSWDRYEGAEDV